MEPVSAFENRLRKNARHFRKWAKAQDLTAYRVYDRDIPEWPYAVDWYDGRVQLVEYPRRRKLASGEAAAQLETARHAVQSVLEVPPERIFVKTRQPKVWGQEQYERRATREERFTVREQGLLFEVELATYLDTGLFLDHRLTRARVREEAKGKRFLNLFAYTGAFTVYAAAGGAQDSTTVDLSNTYLDWAERNLKLNGLWGPQHHLVRADVLRWIDDAAEGKDRWDLIVLDPPSFSTSKRMSGTFDVQRDHVRLLERVSRMLSPGGVLYFSNNFTGFRLDEKRLPQLGFEELTPRSIPPDFHEKEVHRCWRITLHATGRS
jgi:23S rRNA (cytosine1962-C5)-methyltransferase